MSKARRFVFRVNSHQDLHRPEMLDGFDLRRGCSRENDKAHGCRVGRAAGEPAVKALIICPDIGDLTQGWRKGGAR